MVFIDKTGELPTKEDFETAIITVKRAMTVSVLKLPPELGVELGNILRCLAVGYKAIYGR